MSPNILKRLDFTARLVAACVFSLMLIATASAMTLGSVKRSSTQPPVFSLAAPFDFTNPQNRYDLTITNKSKWDIHEVYVETSENQKNWGKEWLGDRILTTGTFIVIKNLKPGEYDVKFVDEEDDECVLENIAITKNTAWALTTAWLEKCEGYR